jgi:hypothetical protein
VGGGPPRADPSLVREFWIKKRRIDGLLVYDGQGELRSWSEKSPDEWKHYVRGKTIEGIQAKAARLDSPLLGQTYFADVLMRDEATLPARRINRTVALCIDDQLH